MTNENSESFASVTSSMSLRPLILGHRGASAVAPENTLAAFSRAMSDGADGIEFDVRLARDRIPVVIHDATLKRTGLIQRAVSELTAKELQQIDVGGWFARRTRSASSSIAEKLPLLEQVCELFRENDGFLYIEMKCDKNDGPVLAEAVVRLARDSGLAERVVIESFDLPAIAAVKKIDAGIRTAALFEPKLSQPISSVRRLRMINTACDVGADEIALHHSLASARAIDKASQAGLEIVVWTVADPAWIGIARSLGIKALITNDPASLVHHRR
ncbi:MAG TPA: glycerophosphodiester phosphodiesterase family protein [Pyrinomonadaceae bacterium]|nr:glycerophosphodiester phosphodiesterase family protein [Pyrinomonadaceae bacterium]